MYRRVIGGIKRWLLQEPEEPRRALRTARPEIVVHYWDGAAPQERHIRDISPSGAYIYTTEHWYLGTIIRIILQGGPSVLQADGTTAPAASSCVHARVVRHGTDGVGVEFVFRNKKEAEGFRTLLAAIPDEPPKTESLAVTAHTEGQALVEFALLIPLVFLLAVNALNFGGFIFAWITVANAARDAGQYMIMSSASPGPPTPATLAQITTLVTNDVASLLNRASIVVAICTNNTSVANGCTTLIDPEAPTYTLATVDVTYTYKPFIPLFSFPQLNISATLPQSTIHRKAVMRMLQ